MSLRDAESASTWDTITTQYCPQWSLSINHLSFPRTTIIKATTQVTLHISNSTLTRTRRPKSSERKTRSKGRRSRHSIAFGSQRIDNDMSVPSKDSHNWQRSPAAKRKTLPLPNFLRLDNEIMTITYSDADYSRCPPPEDAFVSPEGTVDYVSLADAESELSWKRKIATGLVEALELCEHGEKLFSPITA